MLVSDVSLDISYTYTAYYLFAITKVRTNISIWGKAQSYQTIYNCGPPEAGSL